MGAFLAALAAAGIGAFSTHRSNTQAQKNAREQMAFQERMSSTAAQRSVQDYIKAGLNPALAYERTASTPGGATTNPGDLAASAAQAAMMMNQIKINNAQSKADLKLKQEQTDKTANESKALIEQTSNTIKQGEIMQRQLTYDYNTQDYLRRQLIASTRLTEAMVPEAQNQATISQKLGPGGAAARDMMRFFIQNFPSLGTRGRRWEIVVLPCVRVVLCCSACGRPAVSRL